jgi:hypothetical protein
MYTVVVKIEGVEKKRRSSTLLHVVLGCSLIAKGADYYRYTKGDITPVLPFIAIALLSIAYGVFRKRLDFEGQQNGVIRLVEAVAFSVLGFLLLNKGTTFDWVMCFVMAAISFLLFLTEREIYKDSEIIITDKGLTIPGDYTTHDVPWDVLSNVIIRHDFITVFHKNEKYLQYQVLQTLSELEVAKMNGFCREKIESSLVHRES